MQSAEVVFVNEAENNLFLVVVGKEVKFQRLYQYLWGTQRCFYERKSEVQV